MECFSSIFSLLLPDSLNMTVPFEEGTLEETHAYSGVLFIGGCKCSAVYLCEWK
jgi:hypothetical protein